MTYFRKIPYRNRREIEKEYLSTQNAFEFSVSLTDSTEPNCCFINDQIYIILTGKKLNPYPPLWQNFLQTHFVRC